MMQLTGLNRKLKKLGLKVRRDNPNKCFVVEGEAAKDWQYNRILVTYFNMIDDWMGTIMKLKELNESIIKKEAYDKIIKSTLQSELTQDSSATAHSFHQESWWQASWDNTIQLVEKS